MMSSCWQFKLELKFYSSFAFLGSGEAVGRWARVKREFNWLKRFKHLQCVMREPTKERKYGMKKRIFMISFGLQSVEPRKFGRQVKGKKRDQGVMESKKVWLVVTCEWAAFVILVMFLDKQNIKSTWEYVPFLDAQCVL